MLPEIKDIAQELNIAPETLWKESLLAYLTSEMRLVEMDIRDIQDRYRSRTPQELRQKIESNQIYSHPAWEEMIEWENLVAHQSMLLKIQREIS